MQHLSVKMEGKDFEMPINGSVQYIFLEHVHFLVQKAAKRLI